MECAIIRIIKTIFAVFVTTICVNALAALSDLNVSPPTIDAESFVLMDALTGNVIAEKNPDLRKPPASLTKMMTAYLVFSAIDEGVMQLDDVTTISKSARDSSGSRMFIEVNSQVTIEELLLGLIVQSGNDAAVALAEAVAGTEENFVDLMNQQAKLLGMNNTNFGTATGLPKKDQLTTARDLAILSTALANDYPELYKMHEILEYEHNGILQENRNRLLTNYRGADGIKTGYTRSAGYCLAASAVRHGMRLVGVVLNSSSPNKRLAEMTSLFNFGFTHYRSVELFESGAVLDEVKVWGGAEQLVPVGYGQNDPFRILLSKADANKIRAILINPKPVEAPVLAGDEVAQIQLLAGDEVLASLPAVALKDVSVGPWWQRVTDYVRLHWLAE